MGLIRNPDGTPSDLIKKWFPLGWKSKNQATPIGLTAEVIDALSVGSTPDLSALQAKVAKLEKDLSDLQTAFALHDNNGMHWTQQQIDTRAAAVADVKIAEHETENTHTPSGQQVTRAVQGQPLDSGWEQFKNMDVRTLLDFARDNGIQVPQPFLKDVDGLRHYLAATMNAQSLSV